MYIVRTCTMTNCPVRKVELYVNTVTDMLPLALVVAVDACTRLLSDPKYGVF